MREKFEMYLRELNKHKEVIDNIFDTLNRIYGLPLKDEDIEDLITINVSLLDSLAYRFSKFQDTWEKALKAWVSLKGENIDSLTMIDVLNFAEKVGFSINKEVWWKCRSLRNKISHEYEENYSKISAAIYEIYEFFPILKKILKELEDRMWKY